MQATLPSLHQQPLVSVIVPTYNYGRFISQTLLNLQAQTYQNWECIVVDDGSTDNTRHVVNEYVKKDKRIKYFYQRNQRQSVAKNLGIVNSSGQYLQFLDADDLLEEKKLESQVGHLENCPDVDIVYGSVRYFAGDNVHERRYRLSGENTPWMPEVSGKGETILPCLINGNILAINSALVRRQVVDIVGFFDERLPLVEDWEYWIRCAVAGLQFQYEGFERSMALVRSHPSSSTMNSRLKYASILLMRTKVALLHIQESALALNRQLLIEVEADLGIEEIKRGNTRRGIRLLLKAGHRGRRTTFKIKCFGCSLVSLFVTGRTFEKVYACFRRHFTKTQSEAV